MSDIQRQVQNRIDQIDSQNEGKVADKQAASVIMDAIKNRDPSRLSNYRGDVFHKNDANAQKLLKRMYQEIESALGDKIRSERNDIRTETRIKSQTLSTLIKDRRAITNETLGKDALAGIDEGNQFRYINDQIARAVIKDFEGKFIEGGLIGGALQIIRPNTHLKKAIENIEKKFPGTGIADRIKNEVLPKLSAQLEAAQIIVKQDESQANRLGTLLFKPLGARDRNFMINQWRTNSDFRKYASDNVKRGLLHVGISGITAILTGTLFGGMIKIPGAVIQRKGTFTQDTLANIMSDGKKDASDYLQKPLDNAASFVHREGKKEKNIDTKTAKQISVQLANGIVINVDGLIDKLNQSENRVRNFIDKVTLGLTDDERILKKKLIAYGELMKQDRVLTQSEITKAYAMHGDISEMIEKWTQRESKRTGKRAFNAGVSLQALSDTKETARLTSASESLSRGARFETFLNNNRDIIEDIVPNKPEYRNTYNAIMACINGKSYGGKSGSELAGYIWTDPDIRGAQAMFKAYMYGGNGAVAAYEKIYRTMAPQRSINTKGDKYGEPLPDGVIQNASAVSDYLASTENKSMNLAARYANTLGNIGRKMNIDISITSAAVIKSARNGVFNPAFTGQNTGINTEELRAGKMETKPALVFQVPIRVDGISGMLEIGVKQDCVNLMIGDFIKTRNPNNPEALIELRVPLLYQASKGGGERTSEKLSTKGGKNGGGGGDTPGGEVTGNKGSSLPGGTKFEGKNYTGESVNGTASNVNANSAGAGVPGADVGGNPYGVKVP